VVGPSSIIDGIITELLRAAHRCSAISCPNGMALRESYV